MLIVQSAVHSDRLSMELQYMYMLAFMFVELLAAGAQLVLLECCC
jgi:hypothetical protein